MKTNHKTIIFNKIKPTIEEIVNKNDPELQWILREIKKINKI